MADSPTSATADATPSQPAESKEAGGPRTGLGIWQYVILVAAGAFATTFAQSRVLAGLPTTFLLKDHLHLKREDVSFFFFVVTFAWNLKPFAGILTDAFPLFGTRRKSYMVLGAGAAGILWLVMARFPSAYGPLLLASVAMNIATVFASTVMGGLMVEAGQAFSAPGRISSLRQVVQSAGNIAAPFLGGTLAFKMMEGHRFHASWWTLTMVIAAVTVLALAVLTMIVLRESPVHRIAAERVERPRVRIPPVLIAGLVLGGALATWLYLHKETFRIGISLYALVGMFVLIVILMVFPTHNPVVVKAQGQLNQILESRTLWMAVFMLFLVYTVPGFGTALTFRQEDVMKFDQGFIGKLGSIEGGFGVLAAGFYMFYCRKLNLRKLLIGGVGINAATTFLYLLYHPGTSISVIEAIHATGGFWVIISELALMDLAVRSTPAGCEALGFALMMSVRNFGIALSDLLGSKILDSHVSVFGYSVTFETMVVINAATTLLILFFVRLLPRIVMSRKEGESMKPHEAEEEPAALADAPL